LDNFHKDTVAAKKAIENQFPKNLVDVLFRSDYLALKPYFIEKILPEWRKNAEEIREPFEDLLYEQQKTVISIISGHFNWEDSLTEMFDDAITILFEISFAEKPLQEAEKYIEGLKVLAKIARFNPLEHHHH